MATEEKQDLAREEIENTVLDAVQKGITKVSDLVSYCGPELIDVNVGRNRRELDVPQVMRAIERMVHRGYLVREGERGLDQVVVQCTEAGREAAPEISDRERELVDSYGVHPDSIRLLHAVIEHERENGSLPSISQLRHDANISLITYQMQPLFSQLTEAGLADARGLFRFKIEPTDEGRTAVEEFADLLE